MDFARDERSAMMREVSGPDRRLWLEEIVRDPALGGILPQLRRLAACDAPVLISGEWGSGQELAARAIHNLSCRAPHPFVVLDCGDFSERLIEAGLAGMDGRADGAPHKMGVFEQAGGGTVLLIGADELPLRGQEVLLRLLDRHEVVPLAHPPLPLRARCVFGVSGNLRARISAGPFGEELHALLRTDVLVLPTLRERPDDIAAIARHVLDRCRAHLPFGAGEFTLEAETALRDYAWPFNLRELREVVEEAAIQVRGQRIGVEHLPDRIRRRDERGPLPSLRGVEMTHIQRALQEARGSQRRASRILGISRWSLSRRLRKYGIQPRHQ